MKHIRLWFEELSLLVKCESPLKDTEDEPLPQNRRSVKPGTETVGQRNGSWVISGPRWRHAFLSFPRSTWLLMRAGEGVQSVKGLPYKPEDLSSNLSTHITPRPSGVHGNPSSGKAETGGSLGHAGQLVRPKCGAPGSVGDPVVKIRWALRWRVKEADVIVIINVISPTSEKNRE